MSIASRITSIEEHIGDVYDTLELGGSDLTNVNKNIVNINSELKNRLKDYLANGIEVVWNNWDKVNAEGTSLTLNNTLEGKMSIVLKGNTSQESTTGKQLFEFDTTNYLENTATTLSGTGNNFSISSTGYGTRAICVCKIDFQTLYAYMSSSYSSASIALYSANNNTYESWTAFTNDRTQIVSNWDITQTNSVNLSNYQNKYLWITLRGSYTDGGYSSVTYKDFILSKSSVSAYEPYTGGIASPNPSYPQTIHTVSGDNTIKVEGKNLFKNLPDTKTVHGITMTNDGETISISGTNSSSTFYPSFVFYADGSVSVLSWYPTATAIDTSKGFFTESGTQYLFSILKSGTMSGDSATYLIGRETGLVSLGLYNTESVFTNSIASNSGRINFIAIGFKPSQQVNLQLKIQLEKGSSRTDYMKYQNTNYSVNLGVENLLDLGTQSFTTYKDTTGLNIHAGTYTFSAKVTSSDTSQTKSRVYLYGADGGSQQQFITLNRDSRSSETFTTTFDIVRIVLYSSIDYASSNGKTATYEDIQLEKGSKANSYSEYGTTPIWLGWTGTYQDGFIRNSGKNLLDRSTCEENKALTWATGVTWNDTGSLASDFIKVNVGDKIYANYNYQKMFYDKDKNYLGCLQMDGTVTTGSNGNMASNFVVPNVSGIVYMRLGLRTSSNPNINLLTANIMVNKGDTLLDYEPYGNGEWYVKKELKKHIISNTDIASISSYWYSTYGQYGATIDKTKLGISGVSDRASLCNIAIKINALRNIAEHTYIFNANAGALYFFSSTYDTVEHANEELVGAEIIYNLDIPEYTKITGELESQLNALSNAKSYNQQTNISQSNNDNASIMNASALQNM